MAGGLTQEDEDDVLQELNSLIQVSILQGCLSRHLETKGSCVEN